MLVLHEFKESSNFLVYVKQENILILLHCILKIENIFPGTQIIHSPRWRYPYLACQKNMKTVSVQVTGKSLSEALIFASTNPQYDNRLFIELRVQYMKNPCEEHALCTNCFLFLHSEQFMYTTCSKLVVFTFHVSNW